MGKVQHSLSWSALVRHLLLFNLLSIFIPTHDLEADLEELVLSTWTWYNNYSVSAFFRAYRNDHQRLGTHSGVYN